MLGMSEDEVYVADGILEGGGESRDVALPSSAPGVVGPPPSPPSHLNASASPPTQYRGFGVVLVGHSLGAGVVSLLSMQLKATGHECYTSLECIALSPPPTLSPGAAAAGRRYITTVVVEDDLVSRLSLRSLQLLRVRAVEALLLCRQPKWQVLLFLGVFRRLSPSEDILRQYFFLNPFSAEATVILERNRHLFDSGAMQPALRLAGHVYQLLSKGTRKAHVRNMKGSEMEEILVTPQIMMHHLPDHLQRLLAKALARQEALH
eukprot:CAMPEP_0179440354 /NCGR_PEP_ID=MMETSP0799-20121207/23944_1 /TAXON_ID=46947 /ORGANISM="Geminigera cryophila, Strain CCMP2564" /LENGTH=262 /DNA_ID=CAMNT_0021223601 /DNA_START=24 /DNA_END=809 /DNA_ORIENTATION=-